MVGAVMFTFTDWYATLWDKIDVDFLVEETKKLTKDIKQLNKAVRNYEVYRYSNPLCYTLAGLELCMYSMVCHASQATSANLNQCAADTCLTHVMLEQVPGEHRLSETLFSGFLRSA